MTQDGEVLRFDIQRGFGFIGTADGRSDVFFHVRDYRGGGSLPRIGERVRFERIDVGGKGPRAMAVQPQSGAPGQPARSAAQPSAATRRPDARPASTAPAPRRRSQSTSERSPDRRSDGRNNGQPWLFGLALLVWVGLLTQLAGHPALPVSTPALLGGLLLLNLATFVAYAMDKNAAARGRWRTPEKTLHTLALAGGWPAAWVAQRLLRHKSSKASFLTVYAATVLANLALLGALWWHKA